LYRVPKVRQASRHLGKPLRRGIFDNDKPWPEPVGDPMKLPPQAAIGADESDPPPVNGSGG
jgi:hypothetical protein